MIVPHGEADYYRLRPTIAIPQPGGERDGIGDRSRRLLRSASVDGAAQAAVGQPVARHRPCVRIARQHALAFRRAGLHGIGDARREERRATAGSIGICRCRPRSAIRFAAWRSPGRCRGRSRGGRRRSPSAASTSSASEERPQRSRIRYENSSDRLLSAAGNDAFAAMRTLRQAAGVPYRPAAGVEYPSTPFGKALAGNRAARQGGRRPRGRVHRAGQLGSPRQRRRGDRPDCHAARRILARPRGARGRSRRSPGRYGHRDDVGVRTRRRGKRQWRNRSRPRQRDDGDRRQRARRRPRNVARSCAMRIASRVATLRSRPISATCSARSSPRTWAPRATSLSRSSRARRTSTPAQSR